MTDVTRNLGALMGQSEAEAALGPAAASAPSVADAGATVGGRTAEVVAGAAPKATMAEGQIAGNPLLHAPDGVSAQVLDKYAFPFQSHEVFGLLPHSIGSKAESLWTLAQSLAGDTSFFSFAVGGILLGAVVIAAVSTARVWRRGDEFAVAGFGDRLTQSGSRYRVRQDAPVGSFADKHGVVRRTAPAKTPAPVIEDDEPETEAATPSPESVLGPASAPAPNTWRARRDAQAAKSKHAKPERKAERIPEPKADRRAEQKGDPKPEPKLVKRGFFAPKPTAEPKPKDEKSLRPDKTPRAGKPEKRPPTPAHKPTIAADESSGPKTVKRQIFKRSATTIPYMGSFHGSYGSFQANDRLFARDYLKQTNDAFEAAYFKGKGPNFSELKIGDNHRAERLFMMATRSSFDDSQSALAALWQAVDEDRTDAVAWLRLAHLYLEVGEFDHARRILDPLQSNSERQGLDIIAAAAANSLGKIAAQRGELEQARKLFGKSLDHAKKTDNPFMIGVASSNSGLLEAARKKFDTAATLLERGIKGFETCEERVSAARSRVALGVVHACVGEDESAQELWSQAHDAFLAAGLDDEAAQVGGWLKGEGAPNTIVL